MRNEKPGRPRYDAALLRALEGLQAEAEAEADNIAARAELEERRASYTALRLHRGLKLVSAAGRFSA